MKCQNLVKFKVSKAHPFPADRRKAWLAKKVRVTPLGRGGIHVVTVDQWFSP